MSCAKVKVPAGKNSPKSVTPQNKDDPKTKNESPSTAEERVMTASQLTFLKETQEDSRMLASGKGMCEIPEGGTLHLFEKPIGEETGHQEVRNVISLKDSSGTLISCVLKNGFIYGPHFADKKSVSSMPEGPPEEEKKEPEVKKVASPTGEPSAEGYIWPTVNRKIRNDSGGDGHFATPRSGGRTHKGIDIAGEVGDKLYAVKEGILSVAEDPAGYGHYTVIDHSPSIYSLYGHLSKYTIKSNGATVTRGQEIGLVGRSGNAIGSDIGTHVHFEIRYDKNAVDPTKKLP
jgi:murein DD-endopeptidase MepM/ murein hydrolase activator NlpD